MIIEAFVGCRVNYILLIIFLACANYTGMTTIKACSTGNISVTGVYVSYSIS